MARTSLQTPNIYSRTIKNVFRRTPLRVGIVLSGFILPYLRATAVARLRVYDVIEMFASDADISVELYLPGRHYDIVIFEKALTSSALDLARTLSRKNTKIVLDVNVDYFSQTTPRVTADMRRSAYELAYLADAISVPSGMLARELRARGVHSRVVYIPEPLPDRYFARRKEFFADVPRLIWCGYHGKASELNFISQLLRRVQDLHGARFIMVSDQDPKLDIGAYEFIKYRERTIATDIIRGDVFIAPRDLNQNYKYHHTFTKIGLPMAVGVPVIASPVPSYLSSPAVFCTNLGNWEAAFDSLYSGTLDLEDLSQRGRAYSLGGYSWERVHDYYAALFRSLV